MCEMFRFYFAYAFFCVIVVSIASRRWPSIPFAAALYYMVMCKKIQNIYAPKIDLITINI